MQPDRGLRVDELIHNNRLPVGKDIIMLNSKDKEVPDKHQPDIVPSSPEKLRDPDKHWDKTDEEGDESFPASDPPGNY